MVAKRKTCWPGDDHFSKYGIGHYGYDAWVCAMTYLRKKRTFVDVGAHIGHFTYNAIGQFKTVIAFEPHPLNFKCLEANASLRRQKMKNNATEVRLLNAAVGDVQLHKPKTYFTDPSDGKNSGAWELSLEPNGGAIQETDFLTLDALQLKDCDMIKIDTQGWEKRVLDGAKATLALTHPVLILEVVNNRNINSRLIDEVCDSGYQIKAIVQKNGIFRWPE